MSDDSKNGKICLRIGQGLGVVGGAFWGILVLLGYLLDFEPGKSVDTDSFWKIFEVCLISATVGAFVGYVVAGRTAAYVIRGHVRPIITLLKSMAMAIPAGAIILMAVWMVFYGLAYTTGAIDFQNRIGVFELMRNAMLMGAIIGGFFGGIMGIGYGVIVSIVMKSAGQ